MDPFVADGAAEIASRAHRELEALVGVSSPSGDVDGAEEALAVCAALLPPEAEIERVECSTPGSAPDLIARIKGQGTGTLLLLGADGDEGVVVKRKAAGTMRVGARGRAAHSGSAPDQGRNALLALAAVAIETSRRHDPDGPERLSVVPTILRSGDAFNVVPAEGELLFDMRADSSDSFETVRAAVPSERDGVALEAEMQRVWPGMDSVDATRELLQRAGERLGRAIVGVSRGGASDASHFAPSIALTVDGLGPRGGAAHNPGEFVLAPSLRGRAEVALALAAEVLAVADS